MTGNLIPSAKQIAEMTDAERAAFVRRCRNEAKRRGFRLKRSRKHSRADRPFALFHVKLQRILFTERYGSQLTLHQIAQWLWGDGDVK